MAGGHDDDDPGFWPGYVAAVSGLVQGLLIMTMALGISIWAIGQMPKLGSLVKPTGPGRENAQANIGPLPRDVDMPPLRDLKASPAIILGNGPPTVVITFLGDAVVVPSAALDAIRTAVEIGRKAGTNRWRLSLSTDTRDPRQERAGYLRLLSLRNALLAAGVVGDAVDLRLISDPSQDGQKTVVNLLPLAKGKRD